jgi:hypothetical protein
MEFSTMFSRGRWSYGCSVQLSQKPKLALLDSVPGESAAASVRATLGVLTGGRAACAATAVGGRRRQVKAPACPPGAAVLLAPSSQLACPQPHLLLRSRNNVPLLQALHQGPLAQGRACPHPCRCVMAMISLATSPRRMLTLILPLPGSFHLAADCPASPQCRSFAHPVISDVISPAQTSTSPRTSRPARSPTPP